MSLSAEQLKLASVFPEISWAIADRVCIFRPEGVLSPKLIARLIAWLAEIERDSAQPFNRFTDLTKLHTFEISKLHVSNVAYWRRAMYAGPLVKSAFLTHSEEALELALDYQSFMDGSQILVSVFQSVQDAADWLGVPPESLGEGSSGGGSESSSAIHDSVSKRADPSS